MVFNRAKWALEDRQPRERVRAMNPLPQSTRNAAEPWTAKEVRQFEKLAAENLPPSVISLRLGRPVAAILTKAVEAGIKLTPLNRPPYGV